jgi:hypothetical protein
MMPSRKRKASEVRRARYSHGCRRPRNGIMVGPLMVNSNGDEKSGDEGENGSLLYI